MSDSLADVDNGSLIGCHSSLTSAFEEEMKIREAASTDASEISRLSGELGYPNNLRTINERIERLSLRSDNLTLVAEDPTKPDKISGWIQANSSETIESGFRVEIVGLVVSKDSRKVGVGRALVKEIERWAKKMNSTIVVVRSNLVRQESHIFYPKIGYSRTKEQAVYKKNLKESSNKSVVTIPAAPLPPS